MSNQVTVCKEMTFDCAHMLSGHNALCKNLHGHTYKVQVSVTGYKLDKGSSQDMIIDFKDLKLAMQNIKDNFDHATIFSSVGFRNSTEDELLELVSRNEMRYYVMPRRTTAEDMATLFQGMLWQNIVATNLTELHVRVYETPTSYAEA